MRLSSRRCGCWSALAARYQWRINRLEQPDTVSGKHPSMLGRSLKSWAFLFCRSSSAGASTGFATRRSKPRTQKRPDESSDTGALQRLGHTAGRQRTMRVLTCALNACPFCSRLLPTLKSYRDLLSSCFRPSADRMRLSCTLAATLVPCEPPSVPL